MKLGSVIEGTDPFPSKPSVLSEFAERFDTWVEDGRFEEKTKKFVSQLPLDQAPEEKRATNLEQQFGKVAAGLVQYTTEVLFLDLWLRPDLAPRDRGLRASTVRTCELGNELAEAGAAR